MAIEDLLPRKFKNVEAFRDFVQIMQEWSNEWIWEPASHIIDLRDPEKIQEKYLALLGSMLGFNMQSDILTVEGYRRLLKEIVTYWSVSGTPYFAKWIGYCEGGSSDIKLLWSNDYQRFTVEAQGGTVYDGSGDWFITPHVNLYLSAYLIFDFVQVKHIFYQFAPITLVLEDIDIPFHIETNKVNVLVYGTPNIWLL